MQSGGTVNDYDAKLDKQQQLVSSEISSEPLCDCKWRGEE